MREIGVFDEDQVLIAAILVARGLGGELAERLLRIPKRVSRHRRLGAWRRGVHAIAIPVHGPGRKGEGERE